MSKEMYRFSIALGAISLMLLVQTAHAQLSNSTQSFMNSNESLPGITPQQHKCISFVITTNFLNMALNPGSPNNNPNIAVHEVELCVLHPERFFK
jgi:hypothetical protein